MFINSEVKYFQCACKIDKFLVHLTNKKNNTRGYTTRNRINNHSVKISDRTGNTRSKKLVTTVADAMHRWRVQFIRHEIPEPEESAKNLMAHVIKTRKLYDVDKLKNAELSQEDANKFEILCRRRLKRIPIQYIIEEWDFRELNLKMRSPVFIPRPETEMLVDLVIQEIRLKGAKRVLELCCGSGAISLALLQEFPEVEITAVDKSEAACQLTKENACRLNLEDRLSVKKYEMCQSDEMNCLEDKFDVIVSNPPYIPSEEMNGLEKEIKWYEDLEALDGGQDGLDIIRIILNISSRLLRNECKLFLEVDPSHPELLREILDVNKHLSLVHMKTYKDFCGKDRFVEIKKSK